MAVTNNFTNAELTVVSFNMHGYNQGLHTVNDLITSSNPDIIMLQEHWLTPANLIRFCSDFPDYHMFGSSALNIAVECGPLVGRPYGGVAVLLKNDLLSVSTCLQTSDRYVIVKIGDMICVNWYMPCVGTSDRQLICIDVLENVLYWRCQYPDCGCIIGGDFNVDLDMSCSFSSVINHFLQDNNFHRCDLLFPGTVKYTYANETANLFSKIDYIVFNDVTCIASEIVDPDINFSDHNPVIAKFLCSSASIPKVTINCNNKNDRAVKHLRWDRADLVSYCYNTQKYLQSIYDELSRIENNNSVDCDVSMIDIVYGEIVDALHASAAITVPQCKQNFFKFWWDQTLDCLKDQSIQSDRLWKSAGRPRSGSLFEQRSKDKRVYRMEIRKRQSESLDSYTNELHEALLRKQGQDFWKCWKAKFENKSSLCRQVDGLVEPQLIAENFAKFFSKSCSNLTVDGSVKLLNQYNDLRANYVGAPYLQEYDFDAELIENVICNLSRGKAAGLDGLTTEHLMFCHPILPAVLAKLFNWMMQAGYVPDQFGLSYTVPLPKGNRHNKSLSYDDFRGISISPVISKVFEHCVLQRFSEFFKTSDNQFGFKKSVGCSHAIYTVRRVVDSFVHSGNTVNLCALDVSKAFDKMNHAGLFVKLMRRAVPYNLLAVLENWFAKCFTCVKWNFAYSQLYKLFCGVRQGGVLSPYLFAVYIDDIVIGIQKLGIGCHLGSICMSVFLYADDILLLAPSVDALQKLLTFCENELKTLDLSINAKKSVCTRVGPRFDAQCCSLITLDGNCLAWVDHLRYLGIYIVRTRVFRCNFDHAKRSFYRSFNAVYGKIGRSASEEVVLSLVKAKCLPCLLYGVDVCPLNKTEQNSLDFPVKRILMKIFRTTSVDVLHECMTFFGFLPVDVSIMKRKSKFLSNYLCIDNILCQCFADNVKRESDAVY